MTHKGVLLGKFVRKNEILSFLEKLKNTSKISINKIYVYKVADNDTEFLVSFKAPFRGGRIKDGLVLHVKNGCLFSINALNKLIEEENKGDELENNLQYQINWDELKNKLIILTGGELSIKNIEKIEDKCSLLT